MITYRQEIDVMEYQAVFQPGDIAILGVVHFHFHHSFPHPNIEKRSAVEWLLVNLLNDIQRIA